MKLTQEEAAELIGVSAEFYARIERGNALPSVMTLSSICVSLRASADVLLGRDPENPGEDGIAQWAMAPPADTPEVRRLLRRLRTSSPSTLRLVTLLIKELERYD